MDETSGQITSWRDFEDRVGALMAMAASRPQDLTLVDTDFVRWPIGQRSVMEAFHQWGLAAPGKHARLLGASFDAFPRVHPRWVAWRLSWAHRVRCYQAPDEYVSGLLPTIVLHGSVGLRLLEPRRGVGVWSRDATVLKAWLDDIDVILQQSHEAFPPTTLGL